MNYYNIDFSLFSTGIKMPFSQKTECLYLIIMCIFSIKIAYSIRTQEASYICEKRDNEMIAKFRLLRNNDTIYQIIGYTAVEDDPDQSTAMTSCADITTPEQKDIYELNVTINLNTDSSSPDCGIHIVSSRFKYKFRVRSQTTAGIKSPNDAYYDFICSKTDSLSSWVRPQAYVKGSLTKVNLQPFYSGLSFGVMDYATNSPLSGEAEIGKEIYYQIGLQSCYNPDTKYDTCGHEFWIAFHSFNDSSSSVLSLYFINPSTITVSVQVESDLCTFSCSPVIVSPNSIGSCSINSSYEVTESSFKAIHVTSPFQCIYVQRQQHNSQYFSIIPILPTDITAQSYHLISAVNDTDVMIVALNTTVLDITPVSGGSVSPTLKTYQAYYHQFGSDSDISGTSVVSDNKIALYKKNTFRDSGGTTTGYALDQVMSDQSAGERFIIPPVFNNWKCLVLKNSTTVKYGSTTSDYNTGSLVTSSITTLYEEVTSTLPMICLAEITASSSVGLIPYEQWSSTYSFVLDHGQVVHTLIIVIDSTSKDALVMENNNTVTAITGTWESVNHVTGSSLTMVGLSLDLSELTSDAFITIKHPTVNFLVMLKSSHITSSSISVALLPGINSIQTNTDTCTGSIGHVGDLFDNNCNGEADEDLQAVSGSNYADMKGLNQDKICFDKLRVMDCDVSPDSAFENSAKQRIIENGCINGRTSDPFRPMSDFTYDSVNSDSLTQLYKSGKVKLVGFDGFDEVYLRCNVRYCFMYDTSCESTCTRRRKRAVSGETPETPKLITLSDIKQQQLNQGSCFDSSTFISVTTVMSVIFASLLGFIIYNFVRIHQLTSHKQINMSMTSFDSKTN